MKRSVSSTGGNKVPSETADSKGDGKDLKNNHRERLPTKE